MKLEHLVATMNQTNDDLYLKMNLNCDTIIANQTNKNQYNERKIRNNLVRILSTNTKGVGANRNLGLIMSNSDICILSDDDMKYVDGYEKIILDSFNTMKDADIIIYNIDTIDGRAERRRNKKIKRVNRFNFMNYGAARIAFRRDSILINNIWFSEMFGGGAKYSSGEDTLFLADALRKKMKIYTFPATIASVSQKKSTWFSGIDEKFYFDKGALVGQIFPVIKYLLMFFYFPFRFNSKYSYLTKVKYLYYGAKNYKKGISYEKWTKNDGRE